MPFGLLGGSSAELNYKRNRILSEFPSGDYLSSKADILSQEAGESVSINGPV
jgi:hypothetical protein